MATQPVRSRKHLFPGGAVVWKEDHFANVRAPPTLCLSRGPLRGADLADGSIFEVTPGAGILDTPGCPFRLDPEPPSATQGG